MLRIYLKKDAPIVAGKCEGFIVKYDDGLAYVERAGGTLRTPDIIKPHIREVTAMHSFPSQPLRTLGEYRQGEVRAFLDRKSQKEYKIFITGKSFEEVFEFYCDIRAGRATPALSWEAAEVPVPDKAEVATS